MVIDQREHLVDELLGKVIQVTIVTRSNVKTSVFDIGHATIVAHRAHTRVEHGTIVPGQRHDIVRGDGMALPDKALIQTLVQRSKAQLADGEEFKSLGMTRIIRATLGDWLVCRAEQQPSCARLLDVAVGLREKSNLPVLAMLAPPPDAAPLKNDASAREYVRQYQTCAWHGCGVAFVLDDGVSSFEPYEELATRGDFDALVKKIAQQLAHDVHDQSSSAFWITPDGSRELEALVRISVDRALRADGFKRHIDDEAALPKTYKGFWRNAEADGVWSRAEGEPQHLALEVKLAEDVEAPLCQVVDHFAHARAAVLVRGVRPKGKQPTMTPAMQRLTAHARVRYIDLALPR